MGSMDFINGIITQLGGKAVPEGSPAEPPPGILDVATRFRTLDGLYIFLATGGYIVLEARNNRPMIEAEGLKIVENLLPHFFGADTRPNLLAPRPIYNRELTEAEEAALEESDKERAEKLQKRTEAILAEVRRGMSAFAKLASHWTPHHTVHVFADEEALSAWIVSRMKSRRHELREHAAATRGFVQLDRDGVGAPEEGTNG